MEDLTKTNAQTLAKVKELANTQQAWTRRGEIFAKKQNNQVFKLLPGETVKDQDTKMSNQQLTHGKKTRAKSKRKKREHRPGPPTSPPTTRNL
ncbi:hypothetical protein ElyMa_000184300 [Elysia marginata]|uniref:Uncharacterized protein n=1 Tax=Elysia marginata TaxID=1093978 RepID=A0AAV4EW21_9GAST|nr:hypothetical protein ElyMa_000184300 [Elysia marginata]